VVDKSRRHEVHAVLLSAVLRVNQRTVLQGVPCVLYDLHEGAMPKFNVEEQGISWCACFKLHNRCHHIPTATAAPCLHVHCRPLSAARVLCHRPARTTPTPPHYWAASWGRTMAGR
jgi:hypothetical protein